jgi:GDP/UDP-N,N'-diacetylbacillosamine 2-epimerase (hydrolysing)
LKYLSCLKQVDGVIGNSSSGLLEAPSFKVGTINIGDRQKGRILSNSVINCHPNKDDILKAINRLYDPLFKESLIKVINPYGDGGASEKIVEVLRKHSLIGIKKKIFYDIPVGSR